MNTRLGAQICQIGGAVHRGVISKEEASKLLTVGLRAAEGDPVALEVQIMLEEAQGGELLAEALTALDAKLNALFPPAPPQSPPPSTNPLAKP